MAEQSSNATTSNGRPSRWMALSALSLWFILATLFIHPLVWLVEQLFLIAGEPWPPLAWPIVAVVHSVLLLLPALLLLRFWPVREEQSLFAAFVLTALFVLALAPMRLAGYTAAQLAAILQIICILVFAVILWGLFRLTTRNQPFNWREGRSWPALLFTPFLIAGWLAWGAPGSLLDTLLNLLVGLLLGVVASMILGRYLLLPLYQEAQERPSTWLIAGFVAGSLLLTLGAGIGTNGQQLLLMPVLGALGWLVVGVGYWEIGGQRSREAEEQGRNGQRSIANPHSTFRIPHSPISLLVGLAAAAPLILVDPDELTLVLNLGTRDVGTWAVYAAGISIVVALSIGALVIGLRRPLSRWQGGMVASGLVVVLWLAAAVLFFTVGQPGFYGERLFVILREQADISAAPTIADDTARRQWVYDTLTAHADRTQAGLRQTLERFYVGYTPYYLVNALEVRGGPLLRWWLARRPEVERVLDSPVLRPLPLSPIPDTGNQPAPTSPPWNLVAIGAPEVWETLGHTGEGIIIGQSDSGVDGNHPEVSDSYRGRQTGSDDYNWFDPWYGSAAPNDVSGHGTHTLGVALGRNVGVAPGASWIGCVNLARNLGNPALYLDCLQFMLAPFPQGGDPLHDGRPDLGAHVLNNSWGCPPIEGCDAQSLLQAVNALRAAGLFVVAAAGNEGEDCGSVSDPIAIYDAVFSVGAVDESGQVASFSSRGPVVVDGSGRIKPDIAAPGVDILSAAPGGSYRLGSGTSDAAPHVAGTVALMWSANPTLIGDIDRTEQILAETARPYDEATNAPLSCSDDGSLPNNVVGYGLLDALAAVQRAIDLQ